MTLKQFFRKYPFKPYLVAAAMGRSTRWLRYQVSGYDYDIDPRVQQQNLQLLQDYFRQVGSDMQNINLSLTPSNGTVPVKDFFEQYPLTPSGVAAKVKRSREWITGVINGRLLKNEENRLKVIKLIEAYIRKAGRELSEISLQ